MVAAMLPFPVRIDIRQVATHPLYSPYVLHHPEHETVTLTFPRECVSITHMRNNYGCKTVYYVKRGEFLKEVDIKPTMTVEVDKDTRITVYTRSKPNLVISFVMYMSRPIAKL
jgi:hypothetical protein